MRIILQKGVTPPTGFLKKEEVQVLFRCHGTPISEKVGAFTGYTVFTIIYAQIIHKFCENNQIKTTYKEWKLSNNDRKIIISLFSSLDFDPDAAEDLVVAGCDGHWTAIKTICIYEQPS